MSNEKFESNELTSTKELLSSSAIDRRRALLKGVGKGAAVLGATVPLKALATLPSGSVFTYNGTGTLTQIRCGISGMTSGVHSRDTDRSQQCIGYSPGYYHKREHFPSGTRPDALITAVFSTCALKVPVLRETCVEVERENSTQTKCTTEVVGTKVPTLLEVMNIKPRPDEFHWLAAWLNAQPSSPAVNYPYSGTDIVAFYAAKDAKALEFIKKYMEKHVGWEAYSD